MTKSVQTKLVLILVLLIVATMLIVGAVMVNRVSTFYDNDFEKQMSSFFDEQLVELENAAQGEDGADRIYDMLRAYFSRLGLDSYRTLYILSAEGSVLKSSNPTLGTSVEHSENIINVMRGEAGTSTNFGSEYMDFAEPITVDGALRYIVYVKDTKEEMQDLNWVLISIIVETLFLGMLVAVVLSFLLAKTITNPIENITKSALKVAAGDFSGHIKVHSKDEIGTLSETFNNMADVLKNTLDDIDGEREKLKTIFLYLTDGVVAFDNKGRLLHINRTAEMMLGESWEGSECTFEDVFQSIGIIDTFAAASKLRGGKYIIVDRKIGEKHLMFHIAPFVAQEGKKDAQGVIVVIHDITEQQKLDRARREFIANVSHELRTPLTNIKSYSETVLDDKDISRETTEHFLQIVVNETDRMIRIVKDLMQLSKLDNNKAEWKFSDFAVAEMLQRVYDSMIIQTRNKKQHLEMKIDPELGQMRGDREKLEQVLINIVSNANKYTREGGRIDVQATQAEDQIYFKISDNGIGIPERELPRIFERFYRVDKARSRAMGGTGLGLAIAKEIVEAHGGKIGITSIENRGTEVIVQLPRYSQPPQSDAEKEG